MKKGVTEKMVRLAKSMYEDARTSVGSGIGNIGKFENRVGVHQGSWLSPLLFIIIMDAISELVTKEVLGDILIQGWCCCGRREGGRDTDTFDQLTGGLENKGLKININKTEIMVCSETDETLMVRDRAENSLKQTETLKYLGSVMNPKGGCEWCQ